MKLLLVVLLIVGLATAHRGGKRDQERNRNKKGRKPRWCARSCTEENTNGDENKEKVCVKNGDNFEIMEVENKRCLFQKIKCSDTLALAPREKCGLQSISEEEKAEKKARWCESDCNKNGKDDMKKVLKVCVREGDNYKTMNNEDTPCLWKVIKCSKTMVKIHRGECGVCTQKNLCAGPGRKRGGKKGGRKTRPMRKRREKHGGQMCDEDGNRMNKCQAEISFCKAAKNGEEIPEIKSCNKISKV